MTDEESGRNAQDHFAGEPIFLDRFEADGRSSDEEPLMNALPLLREALVALKDLARDGKTRTINIHDIPLTPADTRLMDRVLGAGEGHGSAFEHGVQRVERDAVSRPLAVRPQEFHGDFAPRDARNLSVSRTGESRAGGYRRRRSGDGEYPFRSDGKRGGTGWKNLARKDHFA